MPRSAMAIGVATSLAAVAISVQTASSAPAATGLGLSVDASAARHAISPDIYGLNGADAAFAKEIGMPVARWGGNASSRYNFKNHTYNTGSDWYFENIANNSSFNLDGMVKTNLDRGTKPVVTVPMIGWVAKDSSPSHPFTCGFPATRFPQQDKFDQWDANCGNGKLNDKDVTGKPTDTSIKVDASFDGEMVSHLVKTFGTAAQGGVPIYELDNETALWSATHRDVHPQKVSYDELGGKSTATAAAIKAADPGAAVLGPSGWGYCEWIASGVDGCAPGADAAAHGGLNQSQWYLKNMKDYSNAHGGKRFLDYFDQHFYPAISGEKDAQANALRLRSTRSLWDPTYVEESWIGPSGVNSPPLQYIRTAKTWIAKYYPGTKTAITEYNWGALDNINGALAQADVLGIFGREGLDLATMWGEPKPTDPGAFAFRMYRNYNGAGGRFGDVSVSATATDQGQLAVYGAQRSSDKTLTVMVVNKTGSDLTAPLSVAGFNGTGTAQRFTYGPTNLGAIVHGANLKVSDGKVDATYPANSITLLALPPAPASSPTSTASATPTAITPAPSTPAIPSVTPSSTTGPRPPICTATYQTLASWSGGFIGQVTVTAGSAGAKDWRVTWPRPSGRLITSWGAVVRQDGANLTAASQRWNATVAPDSATAFGFIATGTPTAVRPTCSGS